MKKTLITLFLALLNVVASWAHDVEVDGIYYDLNRNENTATVTYEQIHPNFISSTYSGDVVIPDEINVDGVTFAVTSIGHDAFFGCTDLTSVVIGNSVKTIELWAFLDCRSLASISVEEGNTVYDSRENCNAIIETSTNTLVVGCQNTVIPNSVEIIGNSSFYGSSHLTSIEIPNSVITIDCWAFYDCSGLTSLVIPNSVININRGAFGECSGLTSVTIGASVQNIGDEVFYNCPNVEELIYADGCTKALATRLTSAKNVTLPNSVETIGTSAFAFFSDLSSVVIPNSVTIISNGAFSNTGLTSIEIPNSVTSIGSWAFWGCLGLTSVEIPNSVTTIASMAFDGCSNVEELIYADGCTNTLATGLTSVKRVTIPNSITTIDKEAFSGFSCLTSIEIPASVSSVDEDAFKDCTGLCAVTISDIAAWCSINFSTNTSNPLYYAEHLFMDGNEVENLVIPNSVTSICEKAFIYCTGLISLHIPASVTTIAARAFDSCTGLTDVTVEWDTPLSVPVRKNIFGGCSLQSATLHVPAGTADKYRAASVWKDFGNIEEYDEPTGIKQIENDAQNVLNGKYLKNGRVVIMKAGKEYTLDGKMI